LLTLLLLAGYVACNHFWPNFYYDAVPAGRIRGWRRKALASIAGIRRASHRLNLSEGTLAAR
jgi:hypothetical protein